MPPSPSKPPFRVDEQLLSVVKRAPFTLSAEIIPPLNGTELTSTLDGVQKLVEAGVDFLSVTKGAGGSLRSGTLPIVQIIKETYEVPVVAHFTCRDLLPHEIENELIDHHLFGVRNILALRGDPPRDQPDWKARPGSYPYAYQLIEQITRLNHSEYLVRPGASSTGKEQRTATEFCIGAAAYPDHPQLSDEISFFKQKVDAGASYGITQMLYHPESYARFVEALRKHSIQAPIIPGVRWSSSEKVMQNMCTRFEVRPDPDFGAALKANGALEAHIQFVERLKSYGAPGVHFFVLNNADNISQLIRALTR